MVNAYLITSQAIKAGQISLSLGVKFLDFFRSEQCFKFEWTGANYEKRSFLGITFSEKGEKVVFELRGKPSFCEAILNLLQHRDLQLNNGQTIYSRQFRQY